MQLKKLIYYNSIIQLVQIAAKAVKPNESENTEPLKNPFMFVDVPTFDLDYITDQTYSPSGIANQVLQNFFNWLTSTVFWLTFVPFSDRLSPIFSPQNNLRFFGDIQTFNVTNVFQSTFSPEGVLIQLVQNFFNFTINTMFWLCYIPFYDRLSPIFEESNKTEMRQGQLADDPGFNVTEVLEENNKTEISQARLADVPGFNVTDLYYNTYSPSGVAVQLLQNFFNWLTSTIFWLSFTPFYRRLSPVFAPANNLRNIDASINPISYLASFIYSDNVTYVSVTRGKKSFRLIEDLKFCFYNEDSLAEEEEETRLFGDIRVVNITNVYDGAFPPDGVMNQLVQNFLIFVSNTMFWLSYIPFYERLFPVFNEIDQSKDFDSSFQFRFDLNKNSGSRSAAGDDNMVWTLSFGRFANLLTSFADAFENISR
jgi:hypothetical protein